MKELDESSFPMKSGSIPHARQLGFFLRAFAEHGVRNSRGDEIAIPRSIDLSPGTEAYLFWTNSMSKGPEAEIAQLFGIRNSFVPAIWNYVSNNKDPFANHATVTLPIETLKKNESAWRYVFFYRGPKKSPNRHAEIVMRCAAFSDPPIQIAYEHQGADSQPVTAEAEDARGLKEIVASKRRGPHYSCVDHHEAIAELMRIVSYNQISDTVEGKVREPLSVVIRFFSTFNLTPLICEILEQSGDVKLIVSKPDDRLSEIEHMMCESVFKRDIPVYRSNPFASKRGKLRVWRAGLDEFTREIILIDGVCIAEGTSKKLIGDGDGHGWYSHHRRVTITHSDYPEYSNQRLQFLKDVEEVLATKPSASIS